MELSNRTREEYWLCLSYTAKSLDIASDNDAVPIHLWL
jgi:hypothetical protein